MRAPDREERRRSVRVQLLFGNDADRKLSSGQEVQQTPLRDPDCRVSEAAERPRSKAKNKGRRNHSRRPFLFLALEA